MALTLYDSGESDGKSFPKANSIVVGTVTGNLDLLNEAKVQVRIPSLDQEVLARIVGLGAGSGMGLFYAPRMDDEVLVALNEDDPNDAYILGGLWSLKAQPPVSSGFEALYKRVLRTGQTSAVGHVIEFDDGPGQSITITATTLTPPGKQTIKLDPTGITLQNLAGTVKISLNAVTQTITIDGMNIQIGGPTTVKLTLSAQAIQVGDMALTTATMVQGKQVLIN